MHELSDPLTSENASDGYSALLDLSRLLASEIAAGDAVTLAELARQHHTSPSTTHRWMARGLPDGCGGRVYLACVRRGKKWLTSSAAVTRFFASLPQSSTENPNVSPPVVRSPSMRDRASARAQAALKEKYGI